MPEKTTPFLDQLHNPAALKKTLPDSETEPACSGAWYAYFRRLPEQVKSSFSQRIGACNVVFAGIMGLLLLTSACEMQQDIEVKVPAHEPVTLIECYLEPGAPARILATKSVAFFDSVELVPADDLQISLFENGQPIQLENKYQGDSVYYNVFNYISSHKVNFDENARWELVVRRQEEEIARGTAQFLPKPKIKSINYQLSADSLLSLEIEVEDNPLQENYYRLRVRTMDMIPSSGFRGLWNDQTASGNTLKLNTGPGLKAKTDTIIISLYHIDKSYYTFMRSVQKAYDANYNPFAQPANLESNLRGPAMGIFTAVSAVHDTIYLQR